MGDRAWMQEIQRMRFGTLAVRSGASPDLGGLDTFNRTDAVLFGPVGLASAAAVAGDDHTGRSSRPY